MANTPKDDTIEQDAKAARLEWLLNERVGNESPPDLQHAVLARLQETAAPARRGNRLLAAAALLIGGGAVVAVSQLSGGSPEQDDQPATLVSTQDPTPTYVTWEEPKLVRSRLDIEALPKDTRQVFAINLDDNALPALLRLRQLEGLAMTVSTFENPRGGFQANKPAPVYITDDGLERLAALPNLRALVLEGQLKLKGPGLVRVLANSRVRELNLVSMALPDKLLADLCGSPLLALRLNRSQGFGGPALKAIGNSPTIRQVSLIGCTHLDDQEIAQLSGMKALEMLNLGLIGNGTIFMVRRVSPLPSSQPGSGVTDRLLEQLAPLPKLRYLNLSEGGVTDQGMQALSKLTALRELDLGSARLITAAGIESLPKQLESLTLRGHANLNAAMLGALLKRSQLTDLNIRGCRGIDKSAVKTLCAATHLRSLNVSGWKLTNEETQLLKNTDIDVKFSNKQKD